MLPLASPSIPRHLPTPRNDSVDPSLLPAVSTRGTSKDGQDAHLHRLSLVLGASSATQHCWPSLQGGTGSWAARTPGGGDGAQRQGLRRAPSRAAPRREPAGQRSPPQPLARSPARPGHPGLQKPPSPSPPPSPPARSPAPGTQRPLPSPGPGRGGEVPPRAGRERRAASQRALLRPAGLTCCRWRVLPAG